MTFMYHPTEAPAGRKFTDDELTALSDAWVDTPAKFAPSNPSRPVQARPDPSRPVQARLKAKETV